VSEALDLVVHCSRVGGVPRVTEILAVEDLTSGPNSTSFTTTSVFARERRDAPLRWSGNLPVRASRAMADEGIDMADVLDIRAIR
jgi:hypothetical protein